MGVHREFGGERAEAVVDPAEARHRRGAGHVEPGPMGREHERCDMQPAGRRFTLDSIVSRQ
jgi:hypothetical protein